MAYPRQPVRSRDFAVREAARRLLRYPNVTHITLGVKVRRGRRTGVQSLKAYVIRKGKVARRSSIPRHIGVRDRSGRRVLFRTDVVLGGDCPMVFGMQAGHRVMAFDRDLGVAGLTFTKGRRSYVLTNAHVACDIARGGATGPAHWFDPATGRTTRLGDVIYWTPIRPGAGATSDAAVVAVDDPRLIEARKVLGIRGTVERMGMIEKGGGPYWLAFQGQLLNCVEPEPVVNGVPIDVDGVIVEYSRFWQLENPDRRAEKGLSGALLLRGSPGALVACGLVFGGVPDRLIFAYSFKPLFERAFAALPE